MGLVKLLLLLLLLLFYGIGRFVHLLKDIRYGWIGRASVL